MWYHALPEMARITNLGEKPKPTNQAFNREGKAPQGLYALKWENISVSGSQPWLHVELVS